MDFTREEIKLCKQVAGKHRKPIEYGDWYYSKHLKEVLLQSPFINVVRDREIINRDKNIIPLWTISDCLEFLEEKERSYRLENSNTHAYGKYYFACFMPSNHPDRRHGIYKYGKSVLEACLKAVLEILE